jgi:hypothetical protein
LSKQSVADVLDITETSVVSEGPVPRNNPRMTTLLFTCPRTRIKVQHWLDGGQDTPDHEYEAILCKACAGLHFINRKTGKLLGQDDEEEE